MYIDFETYSEAGYYFDKTKRRWRSVSASPPHGLGAVGSDVYASHKSTEIICLSYDGALWLPGQPAPALLLNHIKSGAVVNAWNSAFEYHIWRYICQRRLGWPALPWWQLRDNSATARLHSFPGKMEQAALAINPGEQKDEAGTRLINKFSKPRNPTKHDNRRRILPQESPEDGERFYNYCRQDTRTDRAIGEALAPLPPSERQIWLTDQSINARGVAIDREALADCVEVTRQSIRYYTEELQTITGGEIKSGSQVAAMSSWLQKRGVILPNMEADTITEALTSEQLAPELKRVLELRSILSSASVKKVFSIDRRLSPDGRLRNLFLYAGADRTGRWSGRGPQPQNLPRLKIDVEAALTALSTRSLPYILSNVGCPLIAISGCLRALFVAGAGFDLISSDYTAIEAVVLAAIAGEPWRLELFRSGGHLYETSASKITGTPVADMLEYERVNGEHHPERMTGKVAELASGYQGSVGAWRKFGARGTDEEILSHVRAWRAASPNIVNLWYAVERMASAAIRSPGSVYHHRGLSFHTSGGCLAIRLPSGRCLHYQQAAIVDGSITYYGYKHAGGWQRLDTYGGKLVENITQATARDIMAGALVRLDLQGYPPVLHVHDEPVSEIRPGFGSVADYERIMCQLPGWCSEWPISATGGWRGHRYRKA